MLCASDESGREYVARNPKGLKTRQCLDFFLSLPTRNSKFFAYSFGYDLTKILEDVDDNILYRLIRPELRRVVRGGRKVLAPVYWPAKNPKYALNWMNGRFSVKGVIGKHTVVDPKTGGPTVKYKWGPAVVIHDVWKFFQAHPYGIAPEPWAASLPSGFSSQCKIY